MSCSSRAAHCFNADVISKCFEFWAASKTSLDICSIHSVTAMKLAALSDFRSSSPYAASPQRPKNGDACGPSLSPLITHLTKSSDRPSTLGLPSTESSEVGKIWSLPRSPMMSSTRPCKNANATSGASPDRCLRCI